MFRKPTILLFVQILLSGVVIGQQSIKQQPQQALYANAVYLMEAKNFASARTYFDKYLKSGDTFYKVEAKYYDAICGLKLYHLDGEKLINDFIDEYPGSPLSSMAYVEMGQYFFQDRKYKQAVVYLSKVNQKSISKEKKSTIQYELGYSYFASKKFNKALIEFNKVKKSDRKSVV